MNLVSSWLEGKVPESIPADSGAKTLKTIGFKAPLALKISAEIIDKQNGKSMTEAVEIELAICPRFSPLPMHWKDYQQQVENVRNSRAFEIIRYKITSPLLQGALMI